MSGIAWKPGILGAVGSLFAVGMAFFIGWLAEFRYVPVPIWVIAILTVLLFYHSYAHSQRRRETLTTVFEKKFGVERIIVDGKHFVKCDFDRNELVFLGEKPFTMTRNTLKDVRMKFEDTATLSVTMLRKLYSDPGMRGFAERAMQEITKPA